MLLDTSARIAYTEPMSATPETLAPMSADDAPYDAIAWATGAEAFDCGLSWEQLRAMDALLDGQGEPPEVMLAWRKSYAMGYLAAMRVSERRGFYEKW